MASEDEDLFGSDAEEDQSLAKDPPPGSPQQTPSRLLNVALNYYVPSDDKLYLAKLPAFLHSDPKKFSPDDYEPLLIDNPKSKVDQEALKFQLENTLRWREISLPDGSSRKESNARLIRWSDNSLSLLLADEIFPISISSHKPDDHTYLTTPHHHFTEPEQPEQLSVDNLEANGTEKSGEYILQTIARMNQAMVIQQNEAAGRKMKNVIAERVKKRKTILQGVVAPETEKAHLDIQKHHKTMAKKRNQNYSRQMLSAETLNSSDEETDRTERRQANRLSSIKFAVPRQSQQRYDSDSDEEDEEVVEEEGGQVSEEEPEAEFTDEEEDSDREARRESKSSSSRGDNGRVDEDIDIEDAEDDELRVSGSVGVNSGSGKRRVIEDSDEDDI
ncbi:Paf1 complex component [Nowakowskiella sp. JEL0407]|nr:Paf1 complex component [Nowakowskiella sp. JEL0407]